MAIQGGLSRGPKLIPRQLSIVKRIAIVFKSCHSQSAKGFFGYLTDATVFVHQSQFEQFC